MKRRDFLAAAPVLALGGCHRWPWKRPVVTVLRPGMAAGHALRDGRSWPAPSGERRVDVAILGSGIAGLTAAWTLARAGHRDVELVAGPEPLGNAAGGRFDADDGPLVFPRGAHYLPLPSAESTHVREMLAAFGVIESAPGSVRPHFDERAIVHSPEARLLAGGGWQEGLVPSATGAEAAEHARFFARVEALARAVGRDGRKAFCIPLALSSRDAAFTDWDAIPFAVWLDREGFRAPGLRWYLDYCCRDDYGAGAQAVSAWAGLHYFASRDGHAANAEDGAVLTWPDGLQPLAVQLRDGATAGGVRMTTGMAVRVRRVGREVEVTCLRSDGTAGVLLRARRVVCAMPLLVAQRVVEGMSDFGFDAATDLPASSSWLVANVLLDGFPREPDGVPLAWDNAVQGSPHLGYVTSTHQLIRTSRPAQTVFTTYHALVEQTPEAARRWLATADEAALLSLATGDLDRAYGREWQRRARQIEITVRGHAMASPSPGFLSRPGIDRLREADGPLMFAHADLSGLSVFEEAAWWGHRAAVRILGG